MSDSADGPDWFQAVDRPPGKPEPFQEWQEDGSFVTNETVVRLPRLCWMTGAATDLRSLKKSAPILQSWRLALVMPVLVGGVFYSWLLMFWFGIFAGVAPMLLCIGYVVALAAAPTIELHVWVHRSVFWRTVRDCLGLLVFACLPLAFFLGLAGALPAGRFIVPIEIGWVLCGSWFHEVMRGRAQLWVERGENGRVRVHGFGRGFHEARAQLESEQEERPIAESS